MIFRLLQRTDDSPVFQSEESAPGNLCLNQINARLPDELPEFMAPDGVLYLTIQSSGGTNTAIVAAEQPE